MEGSVQLESTDRQDRMDRHRRLERLWWFSWPNPPGGGAQYNPST
jgi:hypothetical protein